MTRDRYNQLKEFYLSKAPEVFYINNYELARMEDSPSTDPQEWKEFVTSPKMSEHIIKETQYLRKMELSKLLQDASKKDRAVGTAQLISSLDKVITSDNKEDSGVIFVYTYVPLTEEESHADNVVKLNHDPFRKEEE